MTAATCLTIGTPATARAQTEPLVSTQAAAALDTAAEPAPLPEPQQAPPSKRIAYRIGLALTYSLAPALTTTAFLVESPSLGLCTIPLWIFGAPAFHAFGQQPALAKHALSRSMLAVLIGGTIGALVIGLPVGLAINDGGDFGGLEVIVAMVAGLGLGGGAGYLGWAVYDVVTIDARWHARPTRRARTSATIEPLLGALTARDTDGTHLIGFVAGVRGRL